MRIIWCLILLVCISGCGLQGDDKFVSKRSADEYLALAQSSRITTISIAYADTAIAMYLRDILKEIKND